MTKRKPGAKIGRPKIPIDIALVERLASRQSSVREIAACLGIDDTALKRRVDKEPALAAAIKRGQAKGCVTLRTKMFELAMDGNATMLIWLSKQHLGMSDRQEHDVVVEHRDPRIELGKLIDSIHARTKVEEGE